VQDAQAREADISAVVAKTEAVEFDPAHRDGLRCIPGLPVAVKFGWSLTPRRPRCQRALRCPRADKASAKAPYIVFPAVIGATCLVLSAVIPNHVLQFVLRTIATASIFAGQLVSWSHRVAGAAARLPPQVELAALWPLKTTDTIRLTNGLFTI